MRKSGQITVFLSMILLCVCALLFSMAESARMAGARCYLRIAADSAMDSVMGGYHRELWDSYRLLFREYSREEELEKEFSDYLRTYLEGPGWYPATIEKVELTDINTATEEGGIFLEQEILDYMKFGIWTMDFSPQEAGNLKERLQEARAVGRTGEIYSGHTKEAIKVEEALENLDRNLENQRQWKEKGIEALRDCDGARFRQIGNELIQELNQVPALVKTYEKRADLLQRELEKSKEKFIGERKDMGEETIGSLNREIQEYESYVARDGERRKEIEGETSIAQQNKELTEAVLREAEEVEEYIDNWEGEDEEDELDEEELWEPVRRHFETFREGRVTCPHGIKDKEKKNILEKLKRMMDGQFLELVVPDGTEISENVIAIHSLPSAGCGDAQEEKGDFGLTDRLFVNEYCGKFFDDFLQQGERTVQYELEYLAQGGGSDRDNLSETVRDIFLIREGMNLLHIFSDGTKREEARNLAAAIVGASGLAPLVVLTAFLIMTLWAAAEAISDLKILLAGGKVPLWKTREDWKLGLEGMMDFGSSGKLEESTGSGNGLRYTGYLKLLLFLTERKTLRYRIMDIIQTNIKEKQEDFTMESCGYCVDMKAEVCGKHLFFLPGIVDDSSSGGTYMMEMKVRKAY